MKVALDRVLTLTLWILQACLAVLFLYSGASKLSAHEMFWADLFAKIGVGQWFRYFTGGVEVRVQLCCWFHEPQRSPQRY